MLFLQLCIKTKSMKNILLVFIITIGFTYGFSQGLLSNEKEEVFTIVEDMPIPWFYKSECVDVNSASKQACYQSKLNSYLLDKIEYPYQAIKNKIEGTVIVQFVISEDGSISDATILKDIGHGCGKEALEQVSKMPNWIPGKQRGVPVKVRYTLPIKFKLN